MAFDYSYVTGEYNYYEQEANKVDARLEIALDPLVTDLTYPVAQAVEGWITPPTTEITAINKVVLKLTAFEHTDDGLHFEWQTANPGEYPLYVPFGNPPIVGEYGILYGFYETPDIVSVPITPAGDKAEWTTEVAVPQDVKGF